MIYTGRPVRLYVPNKSTIDIYIAVNATTRAHMVKIRAHRKTDRISLS